jgi:hypothetical protein
MIRFLLCSTMATSLLAVALASTPAQDAGAGPEPLPTGAIRQLGEVRLLNIGHVLSLAFAPDGKTIAAASWDDKVRLWDVATGKEIRLLQGHKGRVVHVAYSADGKLLVTQGRAHMIRVWDGRTGDPVRTFETQSPASTSAIAPDGKLLAAVVGKNLVVWEVATGKEVCRHATVSESWYGELVVGFTPDSKQIVSNVVREGLRTILFRNAWTGKEERKVDGSAEARSAWAAALSGNKLLLADWQTLYLMDLTTGLSRKLGTDVNGVRSLAFSPGAKMFAFATGDGSIHVWETVTQKQRCVFRGLEPGSVPVAFAPSGLILASGSTDTTLLLWDLPGIVTGRVQPGKLSTSNLEIAWTDLASVDAAKAYQAMGRLLAQPEAALPFLKEHIKPTTFNVEPALIQRLIKDLASEKFQARDKATADLSKLGEAAELALREALKEKSTLEMRQRVEKLVRALEEKELNPPPERARLLRAVEVVESIGSKESTALLTHWASGAPGAVLTRQAQMALGSKN